jgi:hypothetical protein
MDLQLVEILLRASGHRNQLMYSGCNNFSVLLHMKRRRIVKIVPNITGESSICEHAEIVKYAVPNLLKTWVSFQNFEIAYCWSYQSLQVRVGFWCSGNSLYLYSGGVCFESRPEPGNPDRVFFVDFLNP